MNSIPLLIALLLIPILAFCQIKTLPPKNETGNDPSLTVFVSALSQAIEARDEMFIIRSLSDDVVASYGDDQTIEAFIRYWEIENESSAFWYHLSRVISLGGVFLHDTADQTGKYQFVFPYTYAMDIGLDDDYFMLGVITGKNVNLRAEPDMSSRVITQLNHNIIYYLPDEENFASISGKNAFGLPQWYFITTYEKRYKGWVNWQYVYSLMGPRLFLYKDPGGVWKISAFVEGD
jgi:hypothetical protein